MQHGDNTIVMQGQLEKKAKVRWPLHWCVLTRRNLMVFRSRKDAIPAHVIQLEYVSNRARAREMRRSTDAVRFNNSRILAIVPRANDSVIRLACPIRFFDLRASSVVRVVVFGHSLRFDPIRFDEARSVMRVSWFV